ncbi:MAG: hypothetical protein HQ518_13880 [Rhodopirellula sp.]|nr:hypothetical protein [Rhodopirellula sp.]
MSFITVSSSNPVRHPKFVDHLRDGGIVYARHREGRGFPTEASILRSVVNKQPIFTIVPRDVSERGARTRPHVRTGTARTRSTAAMRRSLDEFGVDSHVPQRDDSQQDADND